VRASYNQLVYVGLTSSTSNLKVKAVNEAPGLRGCLCVSFSSLSTLLTLYSCEKFTFGILPGIAKAWGMSGPVRIQEQNRTG
jgi:hypothetical protein